MIDTDTGATYSVTLDAGALDDGMLTATVTATDAAGNESDPTTVTATKDTVAPALLTSEPADGGAASSFQDIVARFNEALDTGDFVFTLRHDLGFTVDGTVSFENGGQSIVFNPSGMLLPGGYTAELTVADLAGNDTSVTLKFLVTIVRTPTLTARSAPRACSSVLCR